jgi:phosphonate transport system substrate-binding protein
MPFLFLLGLGVRDAVAGEEKFLLFGRVHNDPVRSIRDRQEFVDYIARKLAPAGITAGRIVVVEQLQLLARALKERRVDLFHDSVVPTVVLSKWSGAVPILRQWKHGEVDYEGVILVKKDSGIDTLTDLKGKVIAFDEPHSTSAHVLPRMLLEEKKLKLVQMKSPGLAAPTDAVGYIYGTDGGSPNLLITGRVDAATSSYREIDRLKPEVRETLKVIGTSKSVPRQLIAVRKDLDPKIVKAMKEVLINMDKDPEGQAVLKRQQNTTRIDEIPPGLLDELKYIERYVFSSLRNEVASW